MSREEIVKISSLKFPGSRLVSVQALSTSKSYNNRIYFLELQHHPDSSQPSEVATQTYALKVNGRFWGTEKVQNEVACLNLLERHCPEAPTPAVYAWSGDGHEVWCATPNESGDRNAYTACQMDGKTATHGGWILMSKVEGEPIPTDGQDDATYKELGRQLANFVAGWRRQIPRQPLCGNVTMPCGGKNPSNQDSKDQNADHVVVQGILMDNIKPSEPLRDPNTYYKVRMQDKMRELKDSDTYAPNRHLLPILQQFLDNDLPHLELTGGSKDDSCGYFMFTHYDLSPRNTLIRLDPPQIVGLVDFEFAGFFSPFEEFLNDYIGNGGDWPAPFYTAYQTQLEERGISTPIGSMDKALWNRNYWLESMLNYIAPWWLPGKHEGDALEKQLKKAEQLVLTSLKKVMAATPAPEYGMEGEEAS